MKYRAFLSYSHRDSDWANWLHERFESWKTPPDLTGVPDRLFPIFQDEKELPSSSDLGRQIQEALRESESLVVICSPHAAASRWVNEEILAYKRLGRADRILAVIIEGEPGDGIFPEALRFELGDDGRVDRDRPTEPVAADLRKDKLARTKPADRDHAPKLERESLRIIAGLLGVGFDELVRRDRDRQLAEARRRATRLRRLVVTFALLGLFATAAAFVAWLQWRATEEQKRIVIEREREVNRTFSRSDFFRADELAATGRRAEALAHLARAVRSDPDNVSAGRRILFLLLQHAWYLPEEYSVDAPPAPALEEMKLTIGDRTFEGVMDAAINRERSQIALTLTDQTVLRVDAKTGRIEERVPFEGVVTVYFSERGDLTAATEFGEVMAWSADGTTRVTAAFEGMTVERDGKRLTAGGRVGHGFRQVLFLPEGDMVTVGGSQIEFAYSGNIVVWSVVEDEADRRINVVLDAPVVAAELSPDGRSILVVTKEGDVSLWSLSDGGRIAVLGKGGTPIRFSADGRTITTGTQRWRRAVAEPLSPPFGSDLIDITFHPGGDRLATISRSGRAVIWDLKSGRPVAETAGMVNLNAYSVTSRFNASGTELMAILQGQEARIWSIEEDRVTSIPISEGVMAVGDAWQVAVGGDGEPLSLLELRSGRRRPFPGGESVILGAFDGDRFFGITESGTLHAWSPSGHEVRREFELSQRVLSFDLDAKRGLLLVTADDQRVRLWDWASGRSLMDPVLLPEYQSEAFFGPDCFITESVNLGAGAGHVRVWDLATGLPLSDPIGGDGEAAIGKSQLTVDGGRLGMWILEQNAVTFDLPTGTKPVPGWLADFAEAIGGLRLNEQNVLEPAGRDLKPGDEPGWGEVARWMLEGERTSFRSNKKVRDLVERLLDEGTLDALNLAARAAPDDPKVFDRLAELYREEVRQGWERGAAHAREAERRARRLRSSSP